MPRCCSGHDLSPCYASVLVLGSDQGALAHALDRIESGTICPCVTAWCPACRRVSTLSAAAHRFPVPSAHFLHLVVLHARLELSLDRSCGCGGPI
jgi:hypothetical protein